MNGALFGVALGLLLAEGVLVLFSHPVPLVLTEF
jgi:hypothetical protein